jgi:V/A-type H+-transporting ATPase subunit I
VLHITQTGSAADSTMVGAESRRLVEAIEFLSPRQKKRGGKRSLTSAEFDAVVESYDHSGTIEKLNRLTKEDSELEVRFRAVQSDMARLRPWSGLACAPEELYGLRSATMVLGRFAGRADFLAGVEVLSGQNAVLQEVGTEDGEVLAMVASAPADAENVGRMLAEHRFAAVDMRNVKGRPGEVVTRLEQEAADIAARRARIASGIDTLTAELPDLKVAADAASISEMRQAAAAALDRTDSVVLIQGWVRDRDRARLQGLIDEAGAAALAEVQPATGEEPPVALVNRSVFRPFEMVLDLFSMPSPNELDPTWLIAPFFGVFFALCLTDAGYGIVTAVLTWLLMRKMGMDNKLLGIVLIGAILTVPAGALVGGWFGDVPDRLGVDWLLAFKNKVMWFDPVKDPMKFFVLSIALGYVQMVAGIAFEVVDCVRVKNYGDGLLMQLPWFTFLNALTARIVFAKALPGWAGTLLVATVLASVAAVVVFTQRSRETALSQTLWFALLSAFLLFVGAKLRWLPTGFVLAKWGFWAVYVLMFAHAVVATARARRFKPVPLGLGLVAAVTLGLYLVHIVPAWIPSLVGALFFFLSPSNSGVLARFLWGGYALYGATGYIGVVLSYIRLMALGMCTGGVAVAINVIAWMLLPIPIVGIPAAVLVLVGGHSYNIAVNVLGAFVHSLRLQYVEFFPRFYAGGGERFTPFREQHEFVAVKP